MQGGNSVNAQMIIRDMAFEKALEIKYKNNQERKKKLKNIDVDEVVDNIMKIIYGGTSINE